MNTIRIVVAAPGKIDAAVLNEELRAALGKMPLAFHNAHEAIVECDPADENTVRAVIEAHVANSEAREQAKAIDVQIKEIELAADSPRRRREALLTEEGRTWMAQQDRRIATLREQRRALFEKPTQQ